MSGPSVNMPLTQGERSALMKAANQEKRTDRAQAAWIVCEWLKANGWLKKDEVPYRNWPEDPGPVKNVYQIIAERNAGDATGTTTTDS